VPVPVQWLYLRFKRGAPPRGVVVIIMVPIIIYYYRHRRRHTQREPNRTNAVAVGSGGCGFPDDDGVRYGFGRVGRRRTEGRTRLCRRSPPSCPGDVTVTRGWWFTTTTNIFFPDQSHQLREPLALKYRP